MKMWTLPGAWRSRSLASAVIMVMALSGCGAGLEDGLYVGSDVLWAARHEVGNFSEWTGVAGGGTEAVLPNTVEVSSAHAHQGRFGVKLTITTAANDVQQNAVLRRAGGLPVEAYYSAWYYLPQTVSVGIFWVIMKFRVRTAPDDPGTTGEFYDLDLRTLAGGEMSLRLFDHRRGTNVALDVVDPVVPTERWFHVEAFYRNAQDSTGRLTYWLDGTKLVEVQGAMGPNPWVGWQACSVGENLMPNTAVLYVDDAAISRTRVGPDGVIAR